MYLAVCYFSLFYELLEVACNLQKHAAQCKAGMVDLQRGTLEKSFLFNDSQVSGKAELLQL